MRFNLYFLILLSSLVSKLAISAPYTIRMSTLNFNDFLPITGSCEMDIDGAVTSLLGSQMCISSESATIAHYRLIATPNTNISIQVNTRNPVDGDGITFTPVGKITSDVDDITIIPGQAHIANSGALGRIDIKFGGQIIISKEYAPNGNYDIEMEEAIIWSEQP